MDNFMERITHRFEDTDMIMANGQADAAELDNTKEQLVRFENQLQKVDSALSDMRQVNLKNIESAENMQTLSKDTSEKLGRTAEKLDESANRLGRTLDSVKDESLSKIKETSEASIAGINKTLDESLAKIAEIKENSEGAQAIGESINALSEKLDTLYKQQEEFMHTDHVKIYRNVQASVVEELAKQTEELKKAQKKKGAIIPLVVINLIISLGTLAMVVLSYLGIL